MTRGPRSRPLAGPRPAGRVADDLARRLAWLLARLPATCRALALALVLALPGAARAAEPADAAPLVAGTRTLHVFRGPLGALSATERADNARQKVLRAFDTAREGWTSVAAQPGGVMVAIDGQPLFLVTPGDLPAGSPDSLDTLANQASHAVQTAWREAREQRDPRAHLHALVRLVIALAVLVAALVGVWTVSRWLRDRVADRLAERVATLPRAVRRSRMSALFLGIASRLCVLLAWLLSLVLLFVFLAYSLNQFAHTRALGEGLLGTFSSLLLQSLGAVAAAVPGMFVAVLIFLVAWLATQVSGELFKQVAAGQLKLGMLDQHTAPATRHLVNAMLWLFALAMAYPYLPGAQTEAFKGLSVILGIMVSIGASGLVGQIASGVILVYTRALSLGEYVRIQDNEGTVTEIGLFVTRIRSGLGSEYALPNALVLGNVTRNFSREPGGRGHVLETSVTIGYDTPWRQVHALLLGAAEGVADIARTPAPYVVQTALSDFYVVYRLVTVVSAAGPGARAQAASALNASILDMFNRYGVQIMSPGYYEDPARPKLVPEADWYAAPAKRPDAG